MSQVRIDNAQKALEALQAAGEEGATSEQLAKIAGLRFGARIFDLRRLGWDIETKPRSGTELARYVLHGFTHPGQLGLFEEAHAHQG